MLPEGWGLTAASLGLAFPVPRRGAMVRNSLQGLDQYSAQPVAAVEVHADKLEPDFIDTGAAKKNLAANLFHAQRDFDVGFRTDAEIVIARAHAAAETHLPHHDVRFSPRTRKRGRQGARQDDALITALPDPGTSRAGIERSNRQFAGLKPALGKRLGAIAGIDLRERLYGGDP